MKINIDFKLTSNDLCESKINVLYEKNKINLCFDCSKCDRFDVDWFKGVILCKPFPFILGFNKFNIPITNIIRNYCVNFDIYQNYLIYYDHFNKKYGKGKNMIKILDDKPLSLKEILNDENISFILQIDCVEYLIKDIKQFGSKLEIW